jgi:hypothetical protein
LVSLSKSHNKNHYQAMLDDTNNIYFYRIRSRDAAGRLTGHIVGNGLSTEQDSNGLLLGLLAQLAL